MVWGLKSSIEENEQRKGQDKQDGGEKMIYTLYILIYNKKNDTCGIWTHAPYGINLAG